MAKFRILSCKNMNTAMIYNFIELFHFDFFRNALIAAFLASITCGIIGAYIVSRRMVFISGGITHASFGGIGLGYYLGLNPILGAAVFSVLSALGIRFISKRNDIREDSAIGILWSFGMAVGIIFIFLTPGYAPNLMTFLFGSILTVTSADLIWMAVLTMVSALFFIFFYRIILFVSFDEEYARAHRVPVDFINYLLISLVALAIVLNIRVTGIILVISFLTIPQTTSNLFVSDLKKIIFLSIAIAFAGSIAGLFLSYFLNIPSGATIIFVFVLFFIIGKMIKLLQIKIRVNKALENMEASSKH
jgi:zinc transport system permease protein